MSGEKYKELFGTVCGWRNGEIFVKVESDQHYAKIGDRVTIFAKIPEKKIEITESQFDAVWDSYFKYDDPAKKTFKQKLFNTDTQKEK